MINPTILMGDGTFLKGLDIRGGILLMSVNTPTDRARVMSSWFRIKSTRIVGENVAFHSCTFEGDAQLEAGAMLYSCYVTGDVYAESMRQLTDCHITGKFIPTKSTNEKRAG